MTIIDRVVNGIRRWWIWPEVEVSVPGVDLPESRYPELWMPAEIRRSAVAGTGAGWTRSGVSSSCPRT